jgi:hypothetical protein
LYPNHLNLQQLLQQLQNLQDLHFQQWFSMETLPHEIQFEFLLLHQHCQLYCLKHFWLLISNTTSCNNSFFNCSTRRECIINSVFFSLSFLLQSSTNVSTATPPANLAKRSCNFSLS